MTTTFDSREASRDGLVALFVANGSWQKVFGYYPTQGEIDGQWPLMIIQSMGTLQSMESESMNPSGFSIILTSFVATRDNVSWETPEASDLTDTLDQTTRQIIRNNAGGGAFANAITFAPSPSNVSMIELHRVNYMTEMRLITVQLSSGAK